MQAPTTSECGSNHGHAVDVPKADGDDSGVLEFLRKRLHPILNKRHSAGRIGSLRGSRRRYRRMEGTDDVDGSGTDDVDGSGTDDDLQKRGVHRELSSWPDATRSTGSEDREEGTRNATTSGPRGQNGTMETRLQSRPTRSWLGTQQQQSAERATAPPRRHRNDDARRRRHRGHPPTGPPPPPPPTRTWTRRFPCPPRRRLGWTTR